MLLLILLSMVLLVFVFWLKRDTNKDEPPSFNSNIKWHKLLSVVSDTERVWKKIKIMSNECQKRGGVMTMTVGPRSVYVITDPDDFLTVSNASLQKDPFYAFCKNWLGNGLITAPISTWKVHRKLLNPLFGLRAVDSLMGVFNTLSRQLAKNLEVEVGKGQFDHNIYTRRNALDTICMSALGSQFMDDIEIRNKYINTTDDLMNIYMLRLKNFLLHNNFIYSLSSLKRKEDKYTEVVRCIISSILKQVKESYQEEIKNSNSEKNETKDLKFKPFIRVLLEMFSNNEAFTDNDIRQHVETFIVAGEDTTAGVVLYCILLVGSYPRVQDKLYEELKQNFGEDDRDVTKDDLTKLVYLEAVIKETMRIYPVVPIIGRYLDKDVKLRNCTLSKGRSVILSIYGLHRHSIWGPDADEFRPERWLDPLTKYQKVFAAFSMGRRICIGMSYAMAAVKVTMVHIFRNYKVHGDHTKLKTRVDVTLKPVAGHHISIEKRNKTTQNIQG